MAVAESRRILWKPDRLALMKKLDVRASDAPLFERAYREAVCRFSPRVRYQAAQLEATGDGFVLLSGVFIDDERAACALAKADCAFLFVVMGVAASADMEWLLTLSHLAARDCARVWADERMAQTGRRLRLLFFPQTQEWTDLFSLPGDPADRLCGVAYAAQCCACSRKGKKCAKGCPQNVQ